MSISKEQARDLLIEAVRIPSPSGYEVEVAGYLARKMGEFGFESRIDAAGNVIGEIGAMDGPEVILLGHIDTVRTLLPVTVGDLGLAGRGSVDATGPFCCFVCAAAALADAPTRFVVIGAVEEETTSRGARSLRGSFDPKAVFIGEPSASDGLVIGYKGRIGGSFISRSVEGHMAGPAENASVEASRFWAEMDLYCRSLQEGKALFERPEIGISQMCGDHTFAEIHFDLRIPQGFDIDAFLKFAADRASPGRLRIDEITRAVRMPRSSLPARSLSASIRASGREPHTKLKSGTCDMNVVQEFWAAPSVAYGPGNSLLDHSVDEHLSFNEYFEAIDVLRGALARVADELTPGKLIAPSYDI